MSDPIHNDPYDYDFPEEERSYSNRIATRRFYIFLETFLVMLVSTLILLGIGFLNSYLSSIESPFQELLFFGFNLISLTIATILALVFIQFVFHKSSLPMIESDPPFKETFSLFTVKNFGEQLFHGILILFLVYIPLDFVTYAIPGSLEFSLKSLGGSSLNAYLSFPNFGPFILYGTILHIMVGFREELFFRGIMTVRSEKYINKGSAVVISSVFFGLSHFGYLVYSIIDGTINYAQDIYPAVIWTIGAFWVGSVSAVYILKKKMLWPIIIAHTLNNIISSLVLWLNSVQNVNYWDLALWLYLPLLGVSVLLCVIFFQFIKSSVKSYFEAFKSYKKMIPDEKPRSNAVIADIIFALIFWSIALFVPF